MHYFTNILTKIRKNYAKPKCTWCYKDRIKISVRILWLITKIFMEDPDDLKPEIIYAIKSCTTCLHRLWMLDKTGYVSILPENSEVQRCYVWSMRLLQHYIEYLDFSPLEGKNKNLVGNKTIHEGLQIYVRKFFCHENFRRDTEVYSQVYET